jgi:integrase
MNRLLKVNGHFYFRMRTPKDLLHVFKMQEIKKSMHTKTLKDAKILAVAWSYQLEKLFLRMRCGMLDEKQIAALVKEFLEKTLRGYEQDRAEGRGIPDIENLENPESEYISMHHEGCKVAVDEGRRALALNDLGFIKSTVQEMLEKKKLSVDEKSSEFRMLCREILKAFIQVHEIEQDRILGRYDTLDTHAAVVSSTAESKKAGVLLSKAIKEFLDEKVLKKEFRTATVADCMSVYRVLLQVIGDVDLGEINKEMANRFAEVVSKLPKNMNVIKQFKGKPIDEVLRIVEKKKDTVALLSDTSRSKYVERVSMLMKWCIESAFYINRNYFKKLAVKYDEEDKNRRSFTTEELQKLLQSPMYVTKKIPIKDAHKFFIPLIALFTGMRMNEICQLHCDDVRVIDNVWCFDVNKDTPDKTLKSKAARRIVPIHTTLIEVGFIGVRRDDEEGRT